MAFSELEKAKAVERALGGAFCYLCQRWMPMTELALSGTDFLDGHPERDLYRCTGPSWQSCLETWSP